MSRTKIYFVRHGEVKNPKEIVYGRLPGFGLTEKGKLQIAQTAAFLAKQNIEAIYSSPLLRARQTAEIIRSELALGPIHFSKKILEVQTSAQGRPLSYLHQINHEIYNFKKYGLQGETIADMAKRFESFIKAVSKFHPGENIVAVSHGDPIMALKAAIDKLPFVVNSLHHEYIKHGQALLVEASDGKPVSIKLVFKPQST